jgi:hypothetical protein
VLISRRVLIFERFLQDGPVAVTVSHIGTAVAGRVNKRHTTRDKRLRQDMMLLPFRFISSTAASIVAGPQQEFVESGRRRPRINASSRAGSNQGPAMRLCTHSPRSKRAIRRQGKGECRAYSGCREWFTAYIPIGHPPARSCRLQSRAGLQAGMRF